MNNSLSLAREMKRAESLMRQKKYVEATETVKGVMVRFPNNKELQFAYKNLRVGIPFRGKNRLEVIKQKKSGLLEAFEAKDYQYVNAEASTLTQILPDDFFLWSILAACQVRQKKFSEAILSLKKCLEINKADFSSILNLADANREVGEIEKALLLYQKANELKPNHVPLILNFSRLLLQVMAPKNFIPAILEIITPFIEKNIINDPRFMIDLAIAYFLSEQFEASAECLEKISFMSSANFKELPDREQQVVFGFHNFLRNLLISYSDYTQIKNAREFYHIGESHCLSFAHQQITLRGKKFKIVPKICFGLKAFHLSQSKPCTQKAIFKRHLDNVPSDAPLVISAGEIDCRMEEGFSKAAITKCKSIDVLINQTVQGFANYIIRETKSRTADTFLFNVPAPLKRNDKIFDHHNTHASIVEKFNQSLIKYFKKTPVQIVDLHSETTDASGWSNNVYHCDGIHLDGKIFRVMESHFSP